MGLLDFGGFGLKRSSGSSSSESGVAISAPLAMGALSGVRRARAAAWCESGAFAEPPPLDDTPILAQLPAPKCPQYEWFGNDWQQVSFQDTFDGFKLEAGKQITKNLQTTHSLNLGTAMAETPYTYQFGPVFQTEDGKTVAIGKYSLDGVMNARFIKKTFGDMIDIKANVNSCLTQPERNMAELAADLSLENFSGSTKAVWQGIWIYNAQMAQKITTGLHMGCELTYLNFQGGQSMMTMGARYEVNPQNIIGLTVGRQPDFKAQGMGGGLRQMHNVRCSYTRKVSERFNVGTEFEYVAPDHESSLKFGYEYIFKTGRVQGLIDTAGKISCAIADHKSGFGFSGSIDYARNDYKFGMMMQYFPVPEGAGEQPPPF